MINHYASLRTLQNLNIRTTHCFDKTTKIIQEQTIEDWEQFENLVFENDIFNRDKIDHIRKMWFGQVEKIKYELDLGIKFVCYGEKAYPNEFKLILFPPLIFSYLGSACWIERPCLSVVGSREPHPYTTTWMNMELRKFIKNNDVVIVSGGARGVDFVSHSLAVDLNKPTIAFIPAGISKIYPSSLKNYVKSIVEAGGCIISEYDSDFEMRKHLFQHRNRLIAALNHALLIGEANKQSGTLMTAHLALEIGKPVWVIPGHPLMASFSGSLDLLVEGGQLVRNAEDLNLFFSCELV